MDSFRAYFLFAVLCGAALAWAASRNNRAVEYFYGFAETAETEINFNYPVEIEAILVRPGASVRQGDTLLWVKRARAQEQLADQDFRIAELRAEKQLERSLLENQLAELDAEFAADQTQFSNRRTELTQTATYRSQLRQLLSLDSTASTTFAPAAEKLAALEREVQAVTETYNSRRAGLARELALVNKPREAQAERLAAERDFEAAQQNIRFAITAPATGVVGSIHAKIAEHKSSFAPLIIFYEPNPREVKAYIHEEKVLSAQLGDSVIVTSLASPLAEKTGSIIGLGSRIVEIPSRLRKVPELRTYGREVIIAIPADNPFLQKEKVQLSFSTARDE